MSRNTGIEIPQNLLQKILSRIDTEQRLQRARRRLCLAVSMLLPAIFFSVSAWQSFQSELYTSGFFQYVRLLFSDSFAVFTDWQDYSLSLVESFPIANAIELFGIIFIILTSLKFMVASVSAIQEALAGSHAS